MALWQVRNGRSSGEGTVPLEEGPGDDNGVGL